MRQPFLLETDRLRLQELSSADAEFILALLNEPAFIRFIGDRNVRSLEDARKYIADGQMASYEKHGCGLWRVSLKEGGAVIGMCGLVKRDVFTDFDLGYAFLSPYWGRGYCTEAAGAVMQYAMGSMGLKHLLAVTDQDNVASMRVLEKLGFAGEGLVRLVEGGQELRLFGVGE